MPRRASCTRRAATATVSVGALALTLLAGVGHAEAWTMSCAWDTSGGIRYIPVKVHCDSMESLGLPCDEAARVVQLGMEPWNTQAHANVRLTYAGTTSSTTAQDGEVVVIGGTAHSGQPPTLATTATTRVGKTCERARVRLFLGRNHLGTALHSGGLAANLPSIMAHELGHALGLEHSNQSGSFDCGASLSSDYALMNAAAPPENRLFFDDFIAFRETPCAYGPAIQTGQIESHITGDGGSSWLMHPVTLPGTNMTPAAASGFVGGTQRFVYGRVDDEAFVETWYRDGTTLIGPTAASSSRAMQAPTLAVGRDAAGTSMFVVVFPALAPAPDAGLLQYMWSYDGFEWLQASDSMLRSYNKVAIAYLESRQRFYMVLGDGGPDAHRLHVYSSDGGTSPWTWRDEGTLCQGGPTGPCTTPGIDEEFAWAGPSIVCPNDSPSVEGKCWVVYPDARVATGTLREVVFDTNAIDGVVGPVTQRFAFPRWNTKWVTSRRDVGVTYDFVRDEIFIGFTEQDAAQSAVGVAMAGIDSFIPPGFDGTPPSGFGTGGVPMTSATTGVALTFDTSAGTVWLVGHRL